MQMLKAGASTRQMFEKAAAIAMKANGFPKSDFLGFDDTLNTYKTAGADMWNGWCLAIQHFSTLPQAKDPDCSEKLMLAFDVYAVEVGLFSEAELEKAAELPKLYKKQSVEHAFYGFVMYNTYMDNAITKLANDITPLLQMLDKS